jgi:hypothetical protein
MKASYQPIFKTLAEMGFSQNLADSSGRKLDFKFTPYSLNLKLSFRFENFDDFLDFLNDAGLNLSEVKVAELQTSFVELGLKANEFFYVNFYDADKEQEM